MMEQLMKKAQAAPQQSKGHTGTITAIVRTAAMPQLLYYIERPTITHHTASGPVTLPKQCVPLIAVDQLPEGIEIRDIPRHLTPEHMAGTTDMSNLGTVPKGRSYEVYIDETRTQSVSPSPSPTSRATNSQKGKETPLQNIDNDRGSGRVKNNAPVRAGDVTSRHNHPSRTESSSKDAVPRSNKGSIEHPAERLRAAYMASSRTPVEPSTPSRPSHSHSHSNSCSSTSSFITTSTPPRVPLKQTPPSSSNKTNKIQPTQSPDALTIYCREWCRRGKCRFGALCRYAHEMPRTSAELREVGLAGVPAWWVAQQQARRSKQNNNAKGKKRGGQRSGRRCRCCRGKKERYYSSDEERGGGKKGAEAAKRGRRDVFAPLPEADACRRSRNGVAADGKKTAGKGAGMERSVPGGDEKPAAQKGVVNREGSIRVSSLMTIYPSRRLQCKEDEGEWKRRKSASEGAREGNIVKTRGAEASRQRQGDVEVANLVDV